jgi:lysophospholipid acyltransferase (LPLAT)-like uncharacterized protein
MTKEKQESVKEDLASRGGASTTRKRTLGRRIYYSVGLAMLKFFIRILWRTYRVEKIIGPDIADRIQYSETPFAPCIWHQHLILAAMLIFRWHRNSGYKPCFVVSASVDGDVPSKLTEDLGGRVIRGSSNHGGAKVLRDMRRMFNDGYSIYTTADGPTGPNRVFKEGVPLMSRVTNVPMVPIAFAADRAWYLNRWDSFMIPKPFARIVMAFGEPVSIPKGTPVRELEPWRVEMENAVNSLLEQSKQVFDDKTE